MPDKLKNSEVVTETDAEVLPAGPAGAARKIYSIVKYGDSDPGEADVRD